MRLSSEPHTAEPMNFPQTPIRHALLLGLVVAAFVSGFAIRDGFLSPTVDAASVQAVFSPDGSEPALLNLIASSNIRLDVMLYQFSYTPLQDALIRAQAKGVQVRLILDPKIEANLYTAEKLAQGGVSVRFATRDFASTHAKFLVADGRSVFVGSTNWSRHAMLLNREAAVVIQNAIIAGEFQTVFDNDWSLATPWTP